MPKKIKFIPELQPSNKLYRNISKVVGNEIASVGTACYYPKLIKYYPDIRSDLGINDAQIKEFKLQMTDYYQKMSILTDKQTLMSLIAMIYFIRRRKPEITKVFMEYLAIKFHSSVMHKLFPKYCNDDAWLLALDKLSHKHLYRVHKGIPSTVQYIAGAVLKRYTSKLRSNNLKDHDLLQMVYELRTRLSQSMRSFAESYYRIMEEPEKGKDTEDKLVGIADKISMMITTYGNADKTALAQSIMKSKLRKEYAMTLISEIGDPEFREKIKFVIVLMNRLVPLKNICKESQRLTLIRKIISNQKVDRYSPRDSILEIIQDTRSAYMLNSLNKDQLVSFISHYLTLYLKGRIC